MVEDPDPTMSKLLDRSGGGTARSRLSVWMAQRRQRFGEFVESRQMSWQAMAKVFVEDGLMEKPEHFDDPGPDGVAARQKAAAFARQTWHRVQKQAPKARKRRGAAPATMEAEIRREPPLSAGFMADQGGGARALANSRGDLSERSS